MSRTNKILIVFYGIGRSPFCIKKNLEILQKNKLFSKYQFNLAYALNSLKRINNPRTSEFIDIDESGISSNIDIIDYVYKIDQTEFENQFYRYLNLNKSKRKYDPYEDEFKTVCNLFCQLSLLSNFFDNNNLKEYHAYLVIRDDILIINDNGLFSALEIISQKRKFIHTTSFHWHGGVNDRFILLNNYGKELFNERLSILKNKIKNNCFTSGEKINREAIINLKLEIISSPIKFLRYRANGMKREEIFLLRPYRFIENIRVIFSYIKFTFIKKFKLFY